MIVVAFVVHGQPGAQPRPRFRRHRTFVQTYEPKEATSYKAEIKRALSDAMAGRPRIDEGAIALHVAAYFDRPKSKCSKREPRPREWNPSGKDADNVAKIVMDACNTLAWRDDRQIARLVVEKYIAAQGDTPRVEVRFMPIRFEEVE